MTNTTAPRIPVTRTYRDQLAAVEYDQQDAMRAKWDAAHPELVGREVKILSMQGTGRVAGRGIVLGFTGVNIVVVEKKNGRRIGVNIGWLVPA